MAQVVLLMRTKLRKEGMGSGVLSGERSVQVELRI